jgi:hypothetical protein
MSKKNIIYIITPEELFNFNKPQFNGFGCGHGYYKDKSKYSRKKKHKTNWRDWE